MSSRDTRRTFGSLDAISLRSTENPAAENITYSLLEPLTALDLSLRSSRSPLPNLSPYILQVASIVRLTRFSSTKATKLMISSGELSFLLGLPKPSHL
jgi:hypothetical protein